MARYSFIFLFVLISSACQQQENSKLGVQFKLPKKLREISGMTFTGRNSLMWCLADSGNKNAIYGLKVNGYVSNEITISNLENTDWEDITSDEAGSIYIGDFGNNDNTRKDLAIYKIDKKDLGNTVAEATQKTAFYYPEQHAFPPKRKAMFYDCESFFELNGFFYLFTKNRSKDFDGTTFLYKIPNKEGNFPAQRIGEFKTCADYNNCCITSAALSPDKKKIVLLSHSKIWLFENFSGDAFFNGKATELQLNDYSQKEAVCFLNNNELMIADEKTGKVGGNAYKVSLSDLKSKSKPE